MSASPRTLRWQAIPRRPSIDRRSARRSRFVSAMKLFLPLVAALLVAVVVAWPGVGVRDEGFGLSFVSGGDRASEPGMIRARYMGTDRRNRPFVITADRATQVAGDANTIVLQTLQADLTLEDGTWLALTASSGVYSRDDEILRLEGPISLFSDDGFELAAEAAEVNLSEGTVESDRPISGQGPLGLLDAGAFRFVQEGQRLFFSDGVKVVVFPDAQG